MQKLRLLLLHIVFALCGPNISTTTTIIINIITIAKIQGMQHEAKLGTKNKRKNI